MCRGWYQHVGDEADIVDVQKAVCRGVDEAVLVCLNNGTKRVLRVGKRTKMEVDCVVA